MKLFGFNSTCKNRGSEALKNSLFQRKHFFFRDRMKLQTTLHNYFKMHPVLRETEQWRRCSSHHPTFSIRRLYVSLFLWNHKEHIVWVLIIKWEYVVLLRSFVFIRCSWTSLVGVLIKSLLGSIPWRSLAWVPPPHFLSLTRSLCFSDVPFELPSISNPTSKLW